MAWCCAAVVALRKQPSLFKIGATGGGNTARFFVPQTGLPGAALRDDRVVIAVCLIDDRPLAPCRVRRWRTNSKKFFAAFFSKKQTFLIAPYRYRYRHRHHNNGDPKRRLV
ncbi:hypothetical protein [Acidiphilium sp. MT5]